MRTLATILSLFLLFSFPRELRAQYDKYRFSRLDITQGLSHNEVNCLLRDEKRFLWIGTMSGLNRYDGYSFKVFKHDLRDSMSISDDYIEKFFEGPGHKLWVFTRNGINIYDPPTGKFDRDLQRFFNTIHIPYANSNTAIIDIKKDSLGNYWFLNYASMKAYSAVTQGGIRVTVPAWSVVIMVIDKK